ncbi:hypothetical protein ABZP36_030623 [Zizania latifolia]
MSVKPSDDTTGQVRPEGDASNDKVESTNQNEGEVMPTPPQEVLCIVNSCGFDPLAFLFFAYYSGTYLSILQQAAMRKKYGGIMPRKQPLISKDHERAYFDSADWALGKDHLKCGPLEALRPKLQPTQQQARSRRFLHSSADSEDGLNSPTEDANQNQESNEGKDER